MRGGESLLFMSFQLYFNHVRIPHLFSNWLSMMFVFNHCVFKSSVVKDVKQWCFSAGHGWYIS